MVSGCPFPSKQLKYSMVNGALSVQACHCHGPTTSIHPDPRAAVLGRDLGGLAGPGDIGMAKTPLSLHASPKCCLGERLLISLSESATC